MIRRSLAGPIVRAPTMGSACTCSAAASAELNTERTARTSGSGSARLVREAGQGLCETVEAQREMLRPIPQLTIWISPRLDGLTAAKGDGLKPVLHKPANVA